MNVDMLNIFGDGLAFKELTINLLQLLLLSILPTIFTYSGTSIKDILKIINSNKRACKYVLLSKVWDDSLKSYIKKLAVLALEMLMIVLNIYVILGVIEIFVFFASISAASIGSKNSAITLILIMAGIIIVASFIGKNRCSKICKKVKPVTFTFCESILIIMLVTLLTQNIKICLVVLMFISILATVAIIITFHKCGIYRNYIYLPAQIARTIRHIMLIGFTIYYFIKLQIIENIALWTIIWTIVALFEYIMIAIKDDAGVASVILHTKDGEKVTRGKIIQYEGNKIGYKLLDGREEIIDDDNVEMITYQRRHLIFKNHKEKDKVECKLRNGKVFQYRGFQLIRDSWVEFFTTEGGIRDVLIIKICDTEKIIVKKNNESFRKRC